MNILSPDLVAALDRAGNQPVKVEHPRTHRMYVLVAADQLPPESVAPALLAGQDWTEAMNGRRFALMDKKIDGSITSSEIGELDSLEQRFDVFLDRVAPLPIAAMRELHEQLLNRALQSQSSPSSELTGQQYSHLGFPSICESS